MKKLIIRTLLILISIIFMLQLNVFAAVIVSTDKEVNSGSGNVTISVTSKQALGAYELKLTDTAGLELMSSAGGEISPDKKTITGSSSSGITNLGTYTFKVPTVTVDTTYNVKFSISKMETVDLEEIASETNIAVIIVKAPIQKPSTGTQTPTTPTTPTTPPETTKSSDATLGMLGINPNDFSGFGKNPNQEKWVAEVPNSVTEVEVYTRKKHPNSTIEGFENIKLNADGKGNVSLKEGDNTIKIKVTAEDGENYKIYTLTIKRRTIAEEETANGETRLKSLGIKPDKYDFEGFNKDKTEYSVQIPENINEIEVYATAIDSKAQITGTGMITLKEGINELPVEVIAVDGTKKVYTLKVTRKESEEIEATTTNTFGLSTLSISGLKLNSKFDVETYEYTVELEEDINSLDIQVEANEENATVEVIGNENLKQGENTIKVLVTNNETQEVVTYQVIVNKNIVQQEQIEQKSWLKPETWGKEEKIKIAIIIVLIILIIWAIILKIKISKESDSKRNVALPGADELDKAIAEHQELSEETNNLEENDTEFKYTSENQDKQNYIEEIAKNRLSTDENLNEIPKRRGRHF